jgi:hypothetical protein
MTKHNLPIEVHDHFQKSNMLHGYFMDSLKTGIPHAVEAGRELLAAKACLPHGRWEEECERLFDGSARQARFYMQLSKALDALPKRQKNAILYLETTLEGALQAATKAAGSHKPKKQDKPVSQSLPADSDNGTDQQDTTVSNDSDDLAKKNKKLAHAYRDKLVRAIGDYHDVVPNRAEYLRLKAIVQGVKLW